MPFNKHKFIIASFYLITFLLVSSTGCKYDNGITNVSEIDKHNDHNVAVSFYSGINEHDNVFIITEAKFVLRQMSLKVSGGESTSNIRMDPFVVNLNVSSEGFITVAIATIPLGNYDQLKLQLHKPSPQEYISDPDFKEGNRTYSVIVKGFVNNVPFVFKSSTTAAKGINIDNSPVFVSTTSMVNFTIILNPFFWFYHNGEQLNPMNQSDRNEIEKNIRDSFRRVFKDLDMNGHPD